MQIVNEPYRFLNVHTNSLNQISSTNLEQRPFGQPIPNLFFVGPCELYAKKKNKIPASEF
jgi:hypothetical protein